MRILPLIMFVFVMMCSLMFQISAFSILINESYWGVMIVSIFLINVPIMFRIFDICAENLFDDF